MIAASCNAGLAIWGGLFPTPFFALLSTTPPDDPLPWSWVAAVVGAFAGLYAYAAWKPANADLAIAVGLSAKVAGPLSWLALVMAGRSVPSLFPLVLLGDLAWWLPLGWYLLRRTRWRATVLAWSAVGLHLAASLGLLLVARGTELNPDWGARQQWVIDSTGIWTATWTLWSLSSMSLLAVCLAWSEALYGRLNGLADRRVVIAGCLLVAVGVLFDWSGEALLIVHFTRPEISLSHFEAVARTYQLLSPGVANGLYCVGGFLLSMIAWRSKQLCGLVGMAGFAMWFAAFWLTAATLANQTVMMTVSGAAIMVLFLLWASGLGWQLLSHASNTT